MPGLLAGTVPNACAERRVYLSNPNAVVWRRHKSLARVQSPPCPSRSACPVKLHALELRDDPLFGRYILTAIPGANWKQFRSRFLLQRPQRDVTMGSQDG
jgi:hypothetical protein